MTADDAIALLHEILKTSEKKIQLSDTQIKVFRLIWLEKSYAAIAEETGYEYDYIKQVSCKLWHLLSRLLNQPVSKRNLQTAFQQYAQARKQSSELVPLAQGICYHNLPVCNYSVFIGREAETVKLVNVLSFEHAAHCISIEGLGGMGKTALALSVAYRLESSNVFDAIIFVSAKSNRLTSAGVLPRLQPDRNLCDIFRSIAHTLQCPNILLQLFDEQLAQIQVQLSRQRTLLIIDNLETIEDCQSILAFLHDLPATVKVILTSRQRTPFPAISLMPLKEAESISLMQAHSCNFGTSLSLPLTHQLYQQTSGIPAAIVYAVGLLASGYPIDSLTQSVVTGDYACFYFQSSLMSLGNPEFCALFMAIALFPQLAARDAIAYVAGVADSATVTQGLARLQQLSLISQHEGRFTMLPLTREYAIAELDADPDFKACAYGRRAQWYLAFVVMHGGKDWQDWHDYGPLKQEWSNLQDVIEWCMVSDRYGEVCQFWQKVRCYSHAQGYRGNRLTCWATRLDWTDWLIQAAEQRQDWSTAAEVLFDRAWTLTLMGQSHHLETAASLLSRAWEYRHHTDLSFQIELAIHFAVWQIQKQQLSEASLWLQTAESFLQSASLSEAITYQRLWIQWHYYQGEIDYKTANYKQAQSHFQQVLQQAQQIDWRRVVCLSQEWLADIAMQQKDFSAARLLLQEGLQVAQSQGDQCRTAFYLRSLARLEQNQGNQVIAFRWAEDARQLFKQLGMLVEVEETAKLLQQFS